MKTGRLLKFHRPGGDVQAYLYQEGGEFRASVFVTRQGARRDAPVETITGQSEAVVERAVRAWVDSHFPDPPRGR